MSIPGGVPVFVDPMTPLVDDEGERVLFLNTPHGILVHPDRWDEFKEQLRDAGTIFKVRREDEYTEIEFTREVQGEWVSADLGFAGDENAANPSPDGRGASTGSKK